MSDVKWIKITTSMFDDEKIKLIESMPDRDAILIIWVKLLAQAGKCNASGHLILSEKIPYTDEMLSTIFNRPLNTVRMALEAFKNFGMIEYNELIKISNWQKHQNIDALEKIREQARLRKQKQRNREAETLLLQGNDGVSADVTKKSRDVTQQNKNKKENKIKNKDKELIEKKQKFGEYGHVLLKNSEYQKLKTEFSNLEELIIYLDEYIEMKGYKAKSHYLVIKKWVINAVEEKKQRKNKNVNHIPQHNNFDQREYKKEDFEKYYYKVE